VGLTALMYGVIEAGRTGWGDGAAFGPLLVGTALLIALVWWERAVAARGRTPLVNMSLFRVRSFSAGVGLAALGVFGLFGLLFLLPQYWQAVVSVDTQGAGIRLLPLICGMALGAVAADRAGVVLGARVTVAAGLSLLTAGMLGASTTGLGSAEWQLAVWTATAGCGVGLALATAASAAIVELDEERSGVGTALIQAVVKLGPAIGAAVLGTLLASTYQAHLSAAGLNGLAGSAAETVRSSVFAGLAVAQHLGSATLADEVRSGFVSGMDVAMRWAAAAVAVGIPFAWLMPRRAGAGADLTADLADEQTPAAR
jgi:Na+/melibiose symporter-like transporter